MFEDLHMKNALFKNINITNQSTKDKLYNLKMLMYEY